MLCRFRLQSFFPTVGFWLVFGSLILGFWPERLLAQRPMGIDVSDYQGTTIKWTNVKAGGVTFTWAKATEGLTVNDAAFTANETHAKPAGVYIGAYHFAHPELHADSAGADAEADHFWGIAKNYITNGGFYLQPVLDVEMLTNDATYMSSWANEWCQRIVNYAGSNGVTIKPLIYISSGHAKTWYNSTVTNWGSWIAEWPASPDPTNDVPSSTAPWPTWNVWQYADHGNVSGVPGTNYDLDVFNGNVSNLYTTLVIDGSNHIPANITSSPSSRYADRGGFLLMRVQAGGTAPLGYQWKLNGSSISAATNSALSLTNIQTGNGGSYTVVVTNANGNVTSTVAIVTVNALYTPVFSDNFDVNSSASWTVNHTTDTRTIFAYDYSVIGIPAAPNSTNGTTLGLRMEANISAVKTNAQSASPNGQAFGGNYRLHFDMWINVNGPLPGGGGGSTETITAGVGTLGNRVQWNGNGTTADGVWFVVDGDGGVSDTSTTFGDFLGYIGTSQQASSSGVYLAGTTTDARMNGNDYYENVFPVGQTPPVFQQNTYTNQTGSLAVGSIGLAWHDVVVNKGSSTVDWFIDGLKIASCSAASITASNIFVGYWDPFASISDNTNLSFGLVDNLRVEVPVMAPSISASPTNLVVVQSSNATFNVTATGTPAPNYQWRLNGAPIANATNSVYIRTNIQPVDVGSYSVVVTNTDGSATSGNAILTLAVPPSITTPPVSQTANQSSNVTFSVIATGTAPLGYQWSKNGSPVGGATLASYTLNNITFNDQASYSVTVTNAAGSTNVTLFLTVIIPPAITAQPTNLTVNAGANPVFSVQVTGSAPIFQWRKNGITIGGATQNSYTLNNVTTTDSASYSVVITNAAGTVTSGNAVLNVIMPPVITASPSNLTVNVTTDAAFSVQATGVSPSYQWNKNGTPIGGATGANYTLSNVTLADSGSYGVVVTNSAGSTSSSAILSVVNVRFTIPHWTANQPVFQFNITGAPGRNYKLEGTSDILNWSTIALLTNETGTIFYTNSATNDIGIFYRVSTPR